MYRMLFSILILFLLGSLLIAGDNLTLDDAKILAVKTKKPLLLDFYTEW